MRTKICTKCLIEKPSAEFSKDKRLKSGLASWCKQCTNVASLKIRKKKYKDPKVREAINIKCARDARKRPEKYILNRAKRRAKEKGIEFNLDLSDINIPRLCPLLQIPIKMGPYTKQSGAAIDSSPSLDRIVPEKGYIKGNVRVVSFVANSIKNKATPEQLKTIAKNIDDYVKSQEERTIIVVEEV